MKVVHFSGGDLSGGAARGAYWLHQGLLSRGVDSRFVVHKGKGLSSADVPIERSMISKAYSRFLTQWNYLPVRIAKPRRGSSFSLLRSGWPLSSVLDAAGGGDILHLHWPFQGSVELRSLERVEIPVVWTLRDMAIFTGGCHYTNGCLKYREVCSSCPQLRRDRLLGLSGAEQDRKLRHIPKNVQFVSISRWLADAATESTVLKGRPIRTIPNGVDPDFWKPDPDRGPARRKVGADGDVPFVLTGAQNLDDVYKGMAHFADAVPLLRTRVRLGVFGRARPSWLAPSGADSGDRYLGWIADSSMMRTLYQAADVFVIPSIQEAFGKTVIEALACGTPVVCFADTGAAEIVRHGVDGYVAERGNPKDLAKGIDWVLSRDPSPLRIAARNRVVESYSSAGVAESYLELYRNLVGG